MNTNSRRTSNTIWLAAAIGFALLLLVTNHRTVQAQQWAGPDGNNNISTLNSGKVGIGSTTFDAWDTTNFKVLGLNTNSGFTIAAGNTSGNALHITDRAYFDGANWKYSVSSAPLANYYLGSGVHGFRVASAGTAGSPVTWTHALFINNSANIGIGTTSPDLTAVGSVYGRVVSIANTTNRSVLELANLQDNLADGTPLGQLNFISGSATKYRTAAILASQNGSSAGIGNLDFYTAPTSGNLTFAMRIDKSGSVGIGTTTPSQKLEVNGNLSVVGPTGSGNIYVSGNINAKYQDVAEWVPASEQIPTGTVVVLDSTKSNQVIASTVSYDTRVAGVISERPGIALGEKSDNKVLVATTGRVRVKVDASRAPIHIGDLLVTSDVPGVAMKSEPIQISGRSMHMPGTLIGKALEPLEKGSGEILVLLSLQ